EARQLIPAAEPLACVNAATYALGSLAPDSLVAAFGKRLATETKAAGQWTASLAETTVSVTDAQGEKRNAYILFVSPTQVNFVIPTGTASGMALIEITSADGYVTSVTRNIAAVAPGLFSVDATGNGWASGVVLRVFADQSQKYEPLVQYDSLTQQFVSLPITINNPDEKVFLVLFGTGWRWRSEIAAISLRAGGVNLPVQYCGIGPLLGLDQMNIELPASLAGRGNLVLEVTIDGQTANPLRFNVK
ncbi:MAG: hypothetical protein HOP19_29590, partial [Acidobacteria bacterium]|nr:hypothetical protein [Acidobacteriota bacterium]